MTAPTPVSKVGRAAVTYAGQGWHVVPLHNAPQGRCSCGNSTCPSPGKHPRTSHGLLEATADPTVVAGWWARWPDANVGVLPGRSGFVVIDLDGPEGEQTAEAVGLLAEPTLEVQTGRGRHRWYRHPGGHVPNGTLGPKTDIRGDAGYVLAPPSVHPTGAVYRWLGTIHDVAELPAALIARIQGQATAAGTAIVADKSPAWMIPWRDVQPGARNNTMTRFVGWAYGKGHDMPSVLTMALGVNSQWAQPLERDEIEAIVRSIGARQAARPSGTAVAAPPSGSTAVTAPASLHAMAYEQVEDAITEGRRDHSDAPRFAWTALDRLIGPLLAGYFLTIGAGTGNGKTAFLLSQMEAWAAAKTTVLYVPLELDPWELRRHWAAWTAGLPWLKVARNEWHDLAPDARDRHEAAIAAQLKNPHVHLPPDRRISVLELAGWVQRAVEEVQAKIVVVDHFHRMDFGNAAQYRVQVTDAARALKDIAREHRVAMVVSAQLNQDPNPIDRYYPPVLKRLKETAGLSEEANVVLMLSRRLKAAVDTETLNAIRSGHRDVRELEDPNVMVVTCRKHRLDDDARDRSVRLAVVDGRVENMVDAWHEHVLGVDRAPQPTLV